MEIPVHIDLYAIIIFLGVIQGLYLTYFFLSGNRLKNPASVYLAMLMFSLSLIILEICLNYTHYITRIITINNFSEAFGFAVAPLLYLYIRTSIHSKSSWTYLLHFIPFLFWVFYSIPDYMQSDAFKFNCYLDVYLPHMDRLPVVVTQDPDPFGLRTYVTQLVILQLIIYLLVSILEVLSEFRRKNLKIWERGSSKLHWLRNLAILLVLSTAVLIVVKAIFFKDQGDHLLASFIALVIYVSSFSQIRRSAIDQGITKRIPGSSKYSRSPLEEDEKQVIMEKLTELMQIDKMFRDNMVSLPSVSRRLSIPPHHLSQVINEKLGQSFFEMIAEYRVRDAAEILKDPKQSNVTIEEVSEKVGYNSKSAFNKAFKKIMGKTPSEYRDSD